MSAIALHNFLSSAQKYYSILNSLNSMSTIKHICNKLFRQRHEHNLVFLYYL